MRRVWARHPATDDGDDETVEPWYVEHRVVDRGMAGPRLRMWDAGLDGTDHEVAGLESHLYVRRGVRAALTTGVSMPGTGHGIFDSGW